MISIEATGLDKLQITLKNVSKGTQKALTRSLNKGIMAVRTSVSKEVRQRYNIKAADVKATLKLERANYSNLSAKLTSTGNHIELKKFKYRVKKRGGVFVQVKKGAGGTLPHAFFVTTKHKGIFERKAASRLPIELKVGPSIPQMIGNEQIIKAITERGKEVYNRELEHQVNYLLSGGK